jgi:gliding motility-associated-like protein
MRFFCIIFLLFSFTANAQPPCASPGGTPASAIAVCGSLVFPQGILPNCTGPLIPQGNNNCGGDLIGSGNSIWYRFHCYQSGTLGFLIRPALATADFDWSVMNITGRPVSDILTTNVSISSNQSQRNSTGIGTTGCTAAGILDYGCGGPSSSEFNRMPNLVAGGDYLLMVTKFTTTGVQGYNLSFNGGTAVLTNPLPPAITSVSTVACNLSQIKVTFSEDILCSSLTTLASEFSIVNGTNVITGVTSACSAGTNSFTELIITLQNPLAGGNYNLVVGNGTDGNTLLDVCNDAMLPASFPFTVSASPSAPTVTAVVNLCQGTTPTALTATGTNLLWYTTATGGTGTSIAPIPSTAATGTSTYYVSQTIGGCESPRALITVTVNATPTAPIANTPIAYCQSTNATPLTATGTGLLWYTTPTGGVGSTVTPTPVTITTGSTTYYVSQTIGNCESPRTAIVVNVNATPDVPVVASPIGYCQFAVATALTAGGTNLLWYINPIGGVGSSIAPTPSTTATGSTTYYVSQTINNCEGPRTAIVVNIGTTPVAPLVITPITYCQGIPAAAVTATGTNLLWYTQPSGGIGIPNTNAPIPSTTAVGSTVYYVSQTLNGCESPRAAIAIIVNVTPPMPTVVGPGVFCQGTTATTLSAIGTNLLWYNNFTGGVGNSIAPTPSTAIAGLSFYYVSQTIGVCEGPRALFDVLIPATPSAPSVSSPVVYCQGAVATAIPGTGVNLFWSTTPTGGQMPTPLIPLTINTGTTTYHLFKFTNYASVQWGFGFCFSPSTPVNIIVNPTPVAPIVTTPVSYCQNTATNPLIATGTNLQWYSTAAGGTASTIAPTPSSATAGIFTYYVAQKLGNCEGPRAAIVVDIIATPSAPVVVSPINYCPNNITLPLTAVGTNLLWYTAATGGVGSSVAPTAATNIFPATFNYYVSQSSNILGCEGPRAQIVVNVDNFLSVNIGADSTICEGQSVKLLPVVTPSGATYEWRAIAVPLSTIDDKFIKDATVNPVDTAVYILKAVLAGCTKEDTININVIWKPKIDAGLTKAICLDSATLLKGIVTHQSSDSITYLWSPIDSLATPDALQTLAYPTKTTLYTISFQAKPIYGCDFKGSNTVKLLVQKVDKAFAGNDTIAVKGVPHVLIGSGGLNYTWSSPTGININNRFAQNALVTLNDDAQFYLKVTNAIGCEGRDTIFIKVYNGPAYYVPNSFTPNGDGLNDIFRAIPVGMSNTVYFRVFNRNGQLMFETNQFLKGWDGTFNGKPQPNGTYVWMVAGTNRDYKKVEMKGTVNLIR